MRTDVTNYVQQLDSPAAEVRRLAVLNLGKLGQSVAIPPLIECLSDPEANVAAEALTALRKLRPPGLSAMFFSRLRAPQFQVRKAAVQGVGDFAAENALSDLGIDIPDAARALAESLHDPHEAVRLAAATALNGLGDNAELVVAEIISALTDQSASVRATACKICKRLGRKAESASALLIGLLGDDDGEVRQLAAEALGETGTDTDVVVPALLGLVGDDDEFVVASALKMLSDRDRWTSPSEGTIRAIDAAVPSIAQALDHPSPEVGKAAADTLGRFDRTEASARKLCLAARADSPRELQYAAVGALKSILESTIPEMEQVWHINQFAWPSSKASILYTAAMFAIPDRSAIMEQAPFVADRLGEMLRGDDEILHIGAAWWSGFARLESCATPLLELLRRTGDSRVREECLRAFSMLALDTVEIGQTILREFETGNRFVQGLSAAALQNMRQTADQACPVLLTAAESAVEELNAERAADAAIYPFFVHVLWTLHVWHRDRWMPSELRPRFEAFIERASCHPTEFVRRTIRGLGEQSEETND